MKIIYFDIGAIFIQVVLILTNITERRRQSLTMKLFIISTFENLITTIFSLVAISLDNAGSTNVNLLHFFHGGYLILHNLTSPFYMLYLIALTGTIQKILEKKFFAIYTIPGAFLFAIMGVNVFTPIVFTIDEVTGAYIHGPLFFILYFVGLFYLVLGVFYIFKHSYLFDKKWILTLFAPYPLILIAMVIETLYPFVVIEPIAIAIGIMFVASAIQRSEDVIDEPSGVGNGSSYYVTTRRAFLNDIHFSDLIVNINNYSHINNSMGFNFANKALRSYADILREIARECKAKASFYHLGSGQFRIQFATKNDGTCDIVAREISNYFKSPVQIESSTINFDTKICIVHYPDDIYQFESAVAFAEAVNKQLVKDITYASTILNTQYYQILLNIDRILNNAFLENGFSVYYQPIYDVEKQEFTTCEALLRLYDKKYGFISPDLFIPAAEASGKIRELGDFMLNEVCSFMASEEFKKLGLSFIEVNLSVVECMNETLGKHISNIIKKYDIDPKFINFEITETAIATSFDSFKDNILEIVNLGSGISLDDFGTGYSSIQRLTELPLQLVKIDRSLVHSTTPKTASVVDKFVKLFLETGFKVVVEGVENETQVKRFSNLGATYIQGFYYSTPLPKGDFLSFMEKNKSIT
ncbi:MAG: EAL domain-containing protein [Sphaerochaetaceae bacterium]|nr:EAL domain-containing protein [Sphaerochaetaceae bacterium]